MCSRDSSDTRSSTTVIGWELWASNSHALRFNEHWKLATLSGWCCPQRRFFQADKAIKLTWHVCLACQPRCKQGSITKPLQWLRFDKNAQEWYLESYTYFANGDHQSISDVCWTTRILPKLLQNLDWNNFSGSAKELIHLYHLESRWRNSCIGSSWPLTNRHLMGVVPPNGHSPKPALPLAHRCWHRPCCNASLYSGHLPERTNEQSNSMSWKKNASLSNGSV